MLVLAVLVDLSKGAYTTDASGRVTGVSARPDEAGDGSPPVTCVHDEPPRHLNPREEPGIGQTVRHSVYARAGPFKVASLVLLHMGVARDNGIGVHPRAQEKSPEPGERFGASVHPQGLEP